MTSKAAKARLKKAVTGRKRREGARHQCGKLVQPKRIEREADILSVGREARQRVFGVSAVDAAKEESGSVVGRLVLSKALANSEKQGLDFLEAAEHFEKLRRAFDAAILNSRLTTNTNYVDQRLGRDNGDGDDQDYIDQTVRARARYNEVRSAILNCGEPMALMAMEMVILDEKEPQSDAMIGALRCGLNSVHRILRYERRAG